MPRKAAKSAVTTMTTRRTSRRSGGISEFLSLDLYRSRKDNIIVFSADENHNGVKVDPVTPSVASNKRTQSVSATQNNVSFKRPRRTTSATPTNASQSSESVVVLHKKTRGRPLKTDATPKKFDVKKETLSDYDDDDDVQWQMHDEEEENFAGPSRYRRKSSAGPTDASQSAEYVAASLPPKKKKKKAGRTPGSKNVATPKKAAPAPTSSSRAPPSDAAKLTMMKQEPYSEDEAEVQWQEMAMDMEEENFAPVTRHRGQSSAVLIDASHSMDSVVEVVQPQQKKKRGRPPKNGAATPMKKAAAPAARRKSAAAAVGATPKKTPKKKVVAKREHPSHVDEDGIQMEVGQQQVALPPLAAAPPSDSPRDQAVKRFNSLRASIDETATANYPLLAAERKMEAVSLLANVVHKATTKMSSSYGNVMLNLKMAEQYIDAEATAPDAVALQHKITSLEQQQEHWRESWQTERSVLMRDKSKLAREKNELESALAARDAQAQGVRKIAEQSHMEKQRMQQELNYLRDTINQLSAQQAAPSAGTRAVSAYLPHGYPRNDQPGTSAMTFAAPNQHNQMMIPPTPKPPAFDLRHLPQGSAIGHSTMAGRAGELISGLANVAGAQHSMASVAVTAATMAEADGQGNLIQRTVRTRVETLAVTDDMDLDQLRALGFTVREGDVEESEGDEEGEDRENGARIEEMCDDEHVEDDGEAPFIEEAE